MESAATLLDCTLRDGGYYNQWDFPSEIIDQYLVSMSMAGIDYVELGFRFLKNQGFKGASAYTTDRFLDKLKIPSGLKLSVMINCSDFAGLEFNELESNVNQLFPRNKKESKINLVRIACHASHVHDGLRIASILATKSYDVGINIMQITGLDESQVENLGESVASSEIKVLYFADSMGGMKSEDIKKVIKALRVFWHGDLGIHAHENMSRSLANNLFAFENGVNWLDSTVTGMGRGPGNVKTEELVIESLYLNKPKNPNLIPLFKLISNYFSGLKDKYRWGTNPFYYLAGKHSIHPSYIQKALNDSRFSEEDIYSVIQYLSLNGGSSFSNSNLDIARSFYTGSLNGSWDPSSTIKNREVLILATGESVANHKHALQDYIVDKDPIVFALNTQNQIDTSLIDYRIACNPVRLLADIQYHLHQSNPLVLPASMMPQDVLSQFKGRQINDFGLNISDNCFTVSHNFCTIPLPLVLAYSLAIATSGQATRILLAGVDGFPPDDPRNDETELVFKSYTNMDSAVPFASVTPSRYRIDVLSIYSTSI